MIDGLIALLLVIGAAFLLLAAMGVWRMPDLYMRLQCSTKATTLGLSCMVLALTIHFSELGITARALLVIIFFFLTAPVAGHVIGRAAYFRGLPLWEATTIDELRARGDMTATAVLGIDEGATGSPGGRAAGDGAPSVHTEEPPGHEG